MAFVRAEQRPGTWILSQLDYVVPPSCPILFPTVSMSPFAGSDPEPVLVAPNSPNPKSYAEVNGDWSPMAPEKEGPKVDESKALLKDLVEAAVP
ncbi:hypothetical protein STEG23_030789 [Scotinomys teguina]